MHYSNKVILQGAKDPTTGLWTLLLGSKNMTYQLAPQCQLLLAAPNIADAHAHTALQITLFAHTVCRKANSIRFSHQSLCSPRVSTLLKAIKCGYLKGCPNLTAHSVNKYINPSPATSKGHMKWMCQGIQSTHRWTNPVPLTLAPRANATDLISPAIMMTSPMILTLAFSHQFY